MIDDFAPRKQRPTTPRKPEQLTGFRPSSNLPPHAGENLLPELDSPKISATTTPMSVPAAPQYPQQSNAVEGNIGPVPIKKKSKKKRIIIPLAFLVLTGAGVGAWYFGFRDTGTTQTVVSQEVKEEVEAKEEAPKTVASPLSGVEVDPSVASRQVTSVMIENSGEARPQSGLLEADVVFEAIAEGGVTRFLALYQAGAPQTIGPIRSARPYYVDWAATFDASYAHAGGSPDGLQRIKELGVKDISAFSDTEIFYRTNDRVAPHNLYSSLEGLSQINQRSGFSGSTFTAWQRKNDVPQAPNASNVAIDISSAFYNVNYTYDAATNSYKRTMGGEPHNDARTGTQISPDTVIVLAMKYSQNGIYSVYQTTGSGAMMVFQDGRAIEGTWQKNGPKDQYSFTDKYGFPLLLNTGQAWVTAVTNISEVTFN